MQNKNKCYFIVIYWRIIILCGNCRLRDVKLLGLWLRLECSLDSLSIDSAHVIYVSEGFDVPRDYRSRRGRETIKRYDVTETYSHVDNIKYSHVNLIGS